MTPLFVIQRRESSEEGGERREQFCKNLEKLIED